MRNDPENLILFDGHCNVCAGSVEWIKRHDRCRRFQYLPIQSDLGRKLYENEGLDPDNIQTLVLIKNAKTYFKSDAVIETVNTLGGFWKCFGVFRIAPKPVRDKLYACFAKNRYRWFGSRDV